MVFQMIVLKKAKNNITKYFREKVEPLYSFILRSSGCLCFETYKKGRKSGLEFYIIKLDFFRGNNVSC